MVISLWGRNSKLLGCLRTFHIKSSYWSHESSTTSCWTWATKLTYFPFLHEQKQMGETMSYSKSSGESWNWWTTPSNSLSLDNDNVIWSGTSGCGPTIKDVHRTACHLWFRSQLSSSSSSCFECWWRRGCRWCIHIKNNLIIPLAILPKMNYSGKS